jgi:5,10-methylenetetrahydromethanopterin reductase
MFVKDEERRFVTAELIRRTSFTGTHMHLVERIGRLREAGYTQFTVQLTPGQEDAVEDWAAVMRDVG